ncbi:hypothetical protein ACJMK2_044075 [Sinanodonta woodiana]|uniref:P/Homo B domain-containing protein n=1 Tax=Sinanodonta woodiana TaxID=1069815 RepID=A0ABD3W0N1_SINWO
MADLHFFSTYFGSKTALYIGVHYTHQNRIINCFPKTKSDNFKEAYSILNSNRGQGLDMNVRAAWEQGITGKGVVVTILDDGIEKDHPDLKDNYDEKASYDVNGHDPDPQPRYDFSNENRMLDGDVTDSVEAQSLSLNPQHIHIYSASWGPDDDGRTVDGPATLARKAFYDGITRGRGGLGSIFVWASGNGGRDFDSCNCDGYTNSIYTLSISSATENGNIPWYSEACSSTLATTYSSGSGGERQIVTTDLRRSCTETHTGTSASAPLAAGLCALALQANPMLTWRDLQHIVVMTAKPFNLHDSDWITNGVGRRVSHSFGYGLMDAGSIVALARNWTTVPPQHICEIRSPDQNKPIPMNGKITVPLYTNGCEGTSSHVKYLEHVQARITLTASRRGEIQIFLTSPMGTRSTLLAKRNRDTSREGFNNWAFMTTHTWGELAKGQWILEIENGASAFRGARLKDWVLVLFGTDRHPQQPDATTTSTSTSTAATTTIKILGRNDRADKQNVNSQHYFTYRQSKKFKYLQPLYNIPAKSDPYKSHVSKLSSHSHHECVFETLAKRNNMSTTQYLRMIKVNLTAAELKEWTLVAMGTATHPQMHDITPPANSDHPFTCSGITSHGVCIECRPGFFKLNDGCVANCPEHFYGTMEMVRVRSTGNTSDSSQPKYQRHGICHACNEACRTCKGPHVSDCYQCRDGYENRDSICQKKLLLNFLDPDMLGFFIWVIVLCIAAVILFGIIFGILQARDHHLLCWKEKRHKALPKGQYNGITLTREELESDLEHVDIIRNRNFQHANLPDICNQKNREQLRNLNTLHFNTISTSRH